MDLSSPIGMVVSIGVILFGIVFLGGNISDFVDIASILLTVVPTLFALAIAFPFQQLARLGKHFGIILGRNKYDPVYYINMIASLAETARANGLIALESHVGSVDDPYLKAAIQMSADATSIEIMEERLEGNLQALTERHAESWAIYDKGAAFAPAFGMVATLVSLVNMLMNLNFADAGGVASLGLNMSAALITTFYGSLMANVIFIPLGQKLRGYHQKEIFCKRLVLDGFIAISKGINPRDVKDMLKERLSAKQMEQI